MAKRLNIVAGGLMFLGGCAGEAALDDEVEKTSHALLASLNYAGIAETVHTSGVVDETNPFFQKVGTNQRTCVTCHGPDQGWTITAEETTRLFRATDGLDPIFMLHDAGSRPDADISTRSARRQAFKSTLMDRGLIRFTRNINPAAEFVVESVDDPYGFSTTTSVSAFRRPSPTANQSKVPATGWAGNPIAPFTSVAATSVGASRLHSQRVDTLPQDMANSMRDFQLGVIFAQSVDIEAGRLDAAGAKGGPTHLMAQPFYDGINDIQGNDPMGKPYTRKVFDIFDAWAVYQNAPRRDKVAQARAAVYRGQEIFNNYEFDISGVPGLNDLMGQEVVRGTCSTCHNAPNVGSHSVFRMFDIGTADPENCGDELPLLTMKNKTTGATRQVCDMGRATGSGRWDDLGRFRAPPLRGLAARAPYFHDGQARNLKAVVKYFNNRFNMGLSGQEKQDLEAFLRAL